MREPEFTWSEPGLPDAAQFLPSSSCQPPKVPEARHGDDEQGSRVAGKIGWAQHFGGCQRATYRLLGPRLEAGTLVREPGKQIFLGSLTAQPGEL